jgi:hypothetical protein
MRVLIALSLFGFLSACAPQKVAVQPTVVEVVRVERVPVPSDLLALHNPSTIPNELTYGELIQLWSADRGTITILNGQIEAIRSLNEEDTER